MKILVESPNGVRSELPPEGNIIYIPTNRVCGSSIRSTINEIETLPTSMRPYYHFVIIECGIDKMSSNQNRRTASKVSMSSGVPIWFLTESLWSQMVTQIHSYLHSNTINRLLRFSYPCYGAGPIKASVLMSILKGNTLHRRDSDQTVEISSSGISPLSVEVELLGRAVANVSKDNHLSRKIVRGVGSSLSGQPARDRRDLDEVDGNLGALLDNAHGSYRNRSSVSDLHQEDATIAMPSYFDNSDVLLRSDETGIIEMGICALRDVFRWIPEMPAKNIFGIDYMQKNLLYQRNDSLLVWHDLYAVHEYDASRLLQTSSAKIEQYMLAELKYAAIRPVWNKVNKQLQRSSHDGFDRLQYMTAWEEALEDFEQLVEPVMNVYTEVYCQAVNRAKHDALKQRLAIRKNVVENFRDDAVDSARKAMEDFLLLTTVWEDLVSACERNGKL